MAQSLPFNSIGKGLTKKRRKICINVGLTERVKCQKDSSEEFLQIITYLSVKSQHSCLNLIDSIKYTTTSSARVQKIFFLIIEGYFQKSTAIYMVDAQDGSPEQG